MERFKVFIESFLSLFAVMRFTGMSTKNPVTIILLFTFIYVYSKLKSDRIQSRIMFSDIILSSALGVLFTAFTICAKYNTILNGMTSRLFCFIILFLCAVGFFALFFHLCIWLMQVCGDLPVTSSAYTPAMLPYIAFAICMLCWLPYFLFEYPAVMTPDSINQFSQFMRIYELNNQHSIIHTAIIGLCYNAGFSIFGDTYAGLAFYTVFQMIFMAFTAGYVIRTLQKAGLIMPCIIAVICFYALIPYNGAFVVTMWKDIPFAGFMTLFAASLLRLLIRDSEENFTAIEHVSITMVYIMSAIMICLLRTNGWYTFIVTVPFIFLIYRRNARLMIPMHIIILALVLFVKYPVMEIYNIKQADFAESVSIPVQQIARVIANGGALTESETEFINKVMDIEQVPTLYQPDVSDNIKNLIRQSGIEYLENNKTEFFKNWLSIGLNHPKSYFDAYIDQTVGFWYPDVSCEVGLSDGIYPNSLGLSWQPVISGSVIVKIKEIVFKLPELIPLYGLLWSMGFMFWLILMLACLCIRSNEPKNIIIILPFIFLVLTLCIAAPVANEFRYAYPVFYALPVLLAAPFIKNSN